MDKISKRITKKEVEHVAWLAKIKLSEDEMNLFTEQFNSILEYFRIIDEDYRNLSQQRQALIKETIRDLRLSGESYFDAKNYDASLVAYKSAIEFLKYADGNHHQPYQERQQGPEK